MADSSAQVLQERLARVFEALIKVGEDERDQHSFGDLNVTMQLAANVATTARTFERQLKQQRAQIMGVDEEEDN